MSNTGPLTSAEAIQLDATLLPALERHHLRLLAHTLRTLQQAARASSSHNLPAEDALARWLLTQAGLSHDPDFARQLAAQLGSGGRQLEQLARQRGVAALALTLDDLIDWARALADQRLAAAAAQPPQGPAIIEPTP